MGAVSELDDAINEATRISPFDMWDHERGRRERMRAELARLRRMADAYAEWCVRDIDNMGRCDCCGGARSNNANHSSTCDVAIHLGLPREKGDGE